MKLNAHDSYLASFCVRKDGLGRCSRGPMNLDCGLGVGADCGILEKAANSRQFPPNARGCSEKREVRTRQFPPTGPPIPDKSRQFPPPNPRHVGTGGATVLNAIASVRRNFQSPQLRMQAEGKILQEKTFVDTMPLTIASRLATWSDGMKNEFTAIIEREGDWYVAFCPEIPGANGQGRSADEARVSLADAIALIFEDRREDALRGIPPDAIRETVTVE